MTHQTASGSSSGKGRLAAVSSGWLKGKSSSIRNRGRQPVAIGRRAGDLVGRRGETLRP